MLTFLPLEQIAEYEKCTGSELNPVKEVLAFELTKMIHGEEEATKAQESAKALFSQGGDNSNMPTTTLTDEDFVEGSIGLLDLLVKTALVPSKKEGRRLVEQGGIEINGEKINDVNKKFEKADFENEIIIKKGKKTFHGGIPIEPDVKIEIIRPE